MENNILAHINSQGGKAISSLDKRTIKNFKLANPANTKGMSDKQILEKFKDSSPFVFMRFEISFSEVQEVFKKWETERLEK